MAVQDVDSVWLTRKIYEDAETVYYENLIKAALTPLAGEVAKARQRLIESRDTFTPAMQSLDAMSIKSVEKKVVDFEKSIQLILKRITDLENRIASIEISSSQGKPVQQINVAGTPKAAPPSKAAPPKQDDDDDVDLFGSDSDEETEAAAKLKEERLKAYEAKKSKKPVLIAKSNVILDVKPWDDETDMKLMEENVRKIEADGLLWGAAKLVPLAYGIHKLQISCVVEDDKVSIDWLCEKLEELEDFVQSIDIAAFNKI